MKYAPSAIKGYQPEKTNQKEHLGKYLYYNQCDSIWNGNGLSIHSSGCGPTAMAVCIVNKTTKNVTPIDTASWRKAKGYIHQMDQCMKQFRQWRIIGDCTVWDLVQIIT